MTKIELSDEYIQPCWICGKVWKRKESHEWFYFNNTVICKDHDSSKNWEISSMALARERMKLAIKQKEPKK